jgi:TolA-binding protein
MKRFLVVLASLMIATSSFAQAVKPAPKPVPATSNSTLTEPERAQLEVITLRQQNVQLRQQVIQHQIQQIGQQLQAESQRIQKDKSDLTERLAKDHGVDTTKFQLDEKAGNFVPITAKPAPAPAKPVTTPAK